MLLESGSEVTVLLLLPAGEHLSNTCSYTLTTKTDISEQQRLQSFLTDSFGFLCSLLCRWSFSFCSHCVSDSGLMKKASERVQSRKY